MSKAMFMDLVRQFASLARRKRKSYADAVHVIALTRVDTIKQEETDAGARTRAIQNLQQFLSTEYQPSDGEFAIRSYD